MSKLNVVRRCYSCGAILQSTNPHKEGYIDSKSLSSNLDSILFCDKCFSEEKYNLTPKEPTISHDFLTMLKDAQATGAFIVYVIDLWSFEASFSRQVTSLIQNLDILVLANKRDLMPEESKDDDLREYVAHRFRAAKLPVVADDIILTSLNSLSDVRDIAEKIEEFRRRHDVYIIGPSGTGKSLFLSSFLRSFSNGSSRVIATFNYPGTALRVMQIPLDSSSMIYDTPGLSIDNSMLSLTEADVVRTIIPTSALKGREITISRGESLYLGGLARIDFVKGGHRKVLLTAYFADAVALRKSPIRKNHEEEFAHLIDKKSVFPTSRLVKSLKDLDVFELAVEETGPRDIGIEGFGWIRFEGDKQTFRIFVPRGVSVYASRSKVK
jgi:30S ribosome assembly GTPase